MRDHVFISDLDGTLLQRDATLSAPSRALLRRVIESGVAFTVASARSVVSIRAVLQGLPLRLPIIEFNGAFISDLESGRHLVVNALERSLALEAFDCMSEGLGAPVVSCFDGNSDHVYHTPAHNEGMASYIAHRRAAKDPRMREVAEPGRYFSEQVVCLTQIAQRGVLQKKQALLAARFGSRVQMHLYEDAYHSGWHWLTIHDAKASKDNAIKTLLQLAGLQGWPVIAFGDNVNDISLFRAAQRAVAVSNAVSELRSLAHEVIGSAEEEAVPRYIAQAVGLSPD